MVMFRRCGFSRSVDTRSGAKYEAGFCSGCLDRAWLFSGVMVCIAGRVGGLIVLKLFLLVEAVKIGVRNRTLKVQDCLFFFLRGLFFSIPDVVGGKAFILGENAFKAVGRSAA